MKAKDYYWELHLAIKNHAPAAIQLQMLYAFEGEFRSLCQSRKAVTMQARDGIIRELNDKWNAVAALYEAKDGMTVLEKDAFVTYKAKGNQSLSRFIKNTANRPLPPMGYRRPIAIGVA